MTLTVAAVQHDIVWEDRAATMAHVVPLIDEAAERGAQLIALTEMFAVGFSMSTAHTAEPVEGPSTAFLVDQAARTGAHVCGSVPILGDGDDRPCNTLVVAGPDGSIDRYAKMHRFTFAGEDRHFAAGSSTTTIELGGVRISLFVCFDLRFAPDFWRLAPDTDAYLVVANWPAARREHWRALLRARAIENQAWVVGVNRVGEGDGIAYTGDSAVIDPLGQVVAEAPENTEIVLVCDIDPAAVADVRTRFPFLADRTD
ncbi:MAG: nitrilase-related carbon-nitrogen hydrolase [Acidimicrobiales bacterium]